MENQNKFVDGLFVKKRETAPDFVKAELSFNQKFITWLQNNFNAKGWANVDILLSKEGKLYAKHNDYVSVDTNANSSATSYAKFDNNGQIVNENSNVEKLKNNFGGESIDISKIPFN